MADVGGAPNSQEQPHRDEDHDRSKWHYLEPVVLHQKADDRRSDCCEGKQDADKPAPAKGIESLIALLKITLADKPPIPFRVPPGIKLIRVDAKSGMRAGPGDPKVILEAFKPGTAPPDSYSVIGTESVSSGPVSVSPDADRAVRTGTGGLY